MTATALDSVIFRDIFTTPAMRAVCSDENRVQKYLDFEAALAKAQARLGIIPKNAAAEISAGTIRSRAVSRVPPSTDIFFPFSNGSSVISTPNHRNMRSV